MVELNRTKKELNIFLSFVSIIIKFERMRQNSTLIIIKFQIIRLSHFYAFICLQTDESNNDYRYYIFI